MVRALASHQCTPGSNPGVDTICGLSLLLILSLAPSGFSLGTPVFPSTQKPTLPNSNSIWNARTILFNLQILILHNQLASPNLEDVWDMWKITSIVYPKFAICTSPLIHLACPTSPPPPRLKFCITFVFHFSWVLQSSQEKLKTMDMHIFYLFSGEGRGCNQGVFGRCKNGECRNADGNRLALKPRSRFAW